MTGRHGIDGKRRGRHMLPLRRRDPVSLTVDQKDGAIIADPQAGQKSGNAFQAHVDVKHPCRGVGTRRGEWRRASDAVSAGGHLFKEGPRSPRLGDAVFEPRPGDDEIGRGLGEFRRRSSAVRCDRHLVRHRLVDGRVGDVFDDLAVFPAGRADIAPASRLAVADPRQMRLNP